MPQLFIPEDCSALLPVGSVTQKNVFWRTTAIETSIDFAQLLDDDKPPSSQPKQGVSPARLGLPLSMWAPAWGSLLNLKSAQTVDGQNVFVGIEGVFLPTPKTSRGSSTPPSPLRVDDLDALEQSRLRHSDGRRVEASRSTVNRLLEFGQAFGRLNPRNDRVALELLEYRAEINMVEALTSGKFQLRVDGVVQSVQLSSGDIATLVNRSYLRIRVGKRAVRLTVGSEAKLSGDTIVDAHPPQNLKQTAGGLFSIRDWVAGGKTPPKAAPPFKQPVRELPRIEIILATPIVQRWELLGYERGSLIGSVLLEPGAEASIEVFTFERLRLEREEQVGAALERNTELTALARSTATVAVDTATELGTRFDFGGDASIPVEAVPGAKLGLSGNTETQTAVNTNVNKGLERVAESTRKSAERFQSTHQVKVVQTTERGRESRSIRKIRNPNAGRTLEFLHFAINERHQVTTQIEGSSRVVVCIENPSLGAFDIGFVFAYEHILKRALLSEDYLAGFAAARILASQRKFEELLRRREAKEAARRRALELARQRAEEAASSSSTSDDVAEPGVPVTGIYQTARQIKDLLKEFIEIDLQAEGQILVDNLNPFLSEDDKPTRARVKKADARFSRWGFWTKFTMAYPGIDDKAADFVAIQFDGEGHASEEEIIAALQTLTDGLDDDWVAAIKMIAVAAIVGTAASVLGGPISGLLQPILIGLLLVSDDMGLPRAITRARQELVSERAVQHGEAAVADLAATEEAADTSSAEAPAAPPQIMKDRELVEAEADFLKLLRHLEAHSTFYQNAVWRAEDPSDRFVRLETMGLAQFVENVLVGFVGNRAMYPLRLETLSKTARDVVQKSIGGQALAPDFAALFQPVVDEIVLPTAAVHCEAYLGRCELLEPYIVERRLIDLETRRARAAREFELARQEGFESKRFEARLLQDPPILDDPTPIPSPTLPNAGDEVDIP